jgi:uncharacterized protein
VHDAKLGRSAKPAHVFQLLFYTDELERLQGVRPSRMQLILGDETNTELMPEDFGAYAARVRERFVERSLELEANADPAYPYPVAACEFCPWWHVCRDKRREDDHLSLVANLHRAQGQRLERAGIHSVRQLGTLGDEVAIPRLAPDTLANLRAQAALQLRSRGRDKPLVEYLRPEHDRGLGRLPAPSVGDVHFDFEGDPMWGEDGLEYLFGTVYEKGGEPRYWPLWAHDRAHEKAALEQWIDWLLQRLERFPDLHVYHYNAYETTALKRLATRHATRELELDELLRRKVFVDLYGITRQAVRAGVESYGLKAMEAVYGYTRSQALDAVGSLRRWQRYLDDGKTKWLDEIAVYNEDDCRSTRALYAWLLARRPEVEAESNLQLAELGPEPPKPPSDRQLELQRRTDALRPHLVGDLPDDESQDTPDQRARRLAFALMGYHTREAKPAWWAYFERRTRTDEQLREDSEAIGGLEVVATDSIKQSWRWTCTFPAQDHKLGPGTVDDPVLEKSAIIESLDDATRTLIVRRSKKHGEVAPSALAPDGPYRVDKQIDSVFAFAQRIADGASTAPNLDSICCCAVPLVCRRGRPRLPPARSSLIGWRSRFRGSIAAHSSFRGRPAPARPTRAPASPCGSCSGDCASV